MTAWFQRSLALLLTCVLISACGLSAQEKTMIETLTSNMETHCIGRYLIDLPKGFVSRTGSFVTLTFGRDSNFKEVEVSVIASQASPLAFEYRVESEAAQIAKQTRDDYKTSMLISTTKLSDTGYLIRAYRNESTKALKSTLYIFIKNHIVKAIADTFDGESIESNEASLNNLIHQIHTAADYQQAGKGFCLESLVIDTDHDYEDAVIYFKSDIFKDITWTVYSSSFKPQDAGMLSRWDSKADLINKYAGHPVGALRRGSKPIADMNGEELLFDGHDYGKLGFIFSAESLRPTTERGFAKPTITIDLHTGSANAGNHNDAVDSSWTQEESLAVWDAVIKSIRPRPGAL